MAMYASLYHKFLNPSSLYLLLSSNDAPVFSAASPFQGTKVFTGWCDPEKLKLLFFIDFY